MARKSGWGHWFLIAICVTTLSLNILFIRDSKTQAVISLALLSVFLWLGGIRRLKSSKVVRGNRDGEPERARVDREVKHRISRATDVGLPQKIVDLFYVHFLESWAHWIESGIRFENIGDLVKTVNHQKSKAGEKSTSTTILTLSNDRVFVFRRVTENHGSLPDGQPIIEHSIEVSDAQENVFLLDLLRIETPNEYGLVTWRPGNVRGYIPGTWESDIEILGATLTSRAEIRKKEEQQRSEESETLDLKRKFGIK
jgi:hypothetical protein